MEISPSAAWACCGGLFCLLVSAMPCNHAGVRGVVREGAWQGVQTKTRVLISAQYSKATFLKVDVDECKRSQERAMCSG